MCTFPIFFWVRKNTQGDLKKFCGWHGRPQKCPKIHILNFFCKQLCTVASSPTSTTLPTSPTSLGKCFFKNCTPVVISFPPQAPAIQCLVQLALCNCNRRTGRLHQILSPHCLCRLENCSRLSDKYIHQTSQQYETQQLGDLSNAPI